MVSDKPGAIQSTGTDRPCGERQSPAANACGRACLSRMRRRHAPCRGASPPLSSIPSEGRAIPLRHIMSPSTPPPRRYHLPDPVTPNSRSEPYPMRSGAFSTVCRGEPSMLAAISDGVGAGSYRRCTPATLIQCSRQNHPTHGGLEQCP